MEYIVAAFRSRSETVKFADFLRRNGIGAQIVNTPKEAGVGCGLSVKIPTPVFPYVKNALRASSLSTFAGFFLIKDAGGRRIVRSI